MMMMIPLMPSLAWLLLSVVPVSLAQQKPNPLYGTGQFDPDAFYRQNVCGIQEQLDNRTLTLENALQGQAIRPIFSQSEFFRLSEDGGIDADYPGLTAVLMDELAQRAQFTWRDSFAVMDSSFVANQTWNDLLLWSANAYDVTVDWWAYSIERASMGITFPEGWYDATIIMIGKRSGQDEKDQFSFWSWTRPFDNTVWALILVTICFSGVVYWILENIDENSDKQQLETNVLENMWLSAVTFTTIHFDFSPRSNAARIFTLSLSFWSMLVASAYTANLASFLVVRNSPELQVDSVDHAVALGLPICVWGNTPTDVAITKEHPTAQLVRKNSNQELFDGVLQEECVVALVAASSWEFWQREASVNSECNLFWVGRAFKNIPAGFATLSDSGTYCTSLITDVLNLHLLKMKEDGFIEDAWEHHIERQATVTCLQNQDSSTDTDSDQLNVQNMGGVFFFHGLLSSIALLVAVVFRCTGWDKIPRFAKSGPLSRANVRQRMSSLLRRDSYAMTASDQRLYRLAHRKATMEVIQEKLSESRRHLFADRNQHEKTLSDSDHHHLKALEQLESASCSSNFRDDDEAEQSSDDGLLKEMLHHELHGPSSQPVVKPAFPDRRRVMNFSEPTKESSTDDEEVVVAPAAAAEARERSQRWQDEQTRIVQEMRGQIAKIMRLLEQTTKADDDNNLRLVAESTPPAVPEDAEKEEDEIDTNPANNPPTPNSEASVGEEFLPPTYPSNHHVAPVSGEEDHPSHSADSSSRSNDEDLGVRHDHHHYEPLNPGTSSGSTTIHVVVAETYDEEGELQSSASTGNSTSSTNHSARLNVTTTRVCGGELLTSP